MPTRASSSAAAASAQDSDDEDSETLDLVYKGRLFDRGPDVKRRRLIRGMMAILVILLGVAWIVVDTKQEKSAEQTELKHETQTKKSNADDAATLTSPGENDKKKDKKKDTAKDDFCPILCSARLDQRKKHHGGDFLNKNDLLAQLESAKNKLIDELKLKYGSYYDAIMLKDGKWRQGFSSTTTTPDKDDLSGPRFRRKLKMKLLEMQVALKAENGNLDGCDCNDENKQSSSRRRRLEPRQIVLPQLPKTYSNFVWTTGGHSAAAGHGNLFNESYTAQMEFNAKPIFEAVGIHFDARNYAMGGMRSAPEFALCQESIFGKDTDVVTWDFGMTDVPKNFKQKLYMSRAAVHPNRPALIGINIHGFDLEARRDIMAKFEETGLTTFYLLEEAISEMKAALPDMLGMNQAQIDAVPDFVRYFKCKEQLEENDPGCKDNKYNEALCSNRQHKASWHPGWKMNALYGNLMSFLLIEHLQGAVEELESDADPATKLAELKAEEDADYERFRRELKLPNEAIPELIEEDVLANVDPNVLHYSPVFCRTALTPSQLRYNGILTETTEKLGMLNYEAGVSKIQADKGMSDGPMRIVFEQNQRNPPCPVLTKVDFKDYFYSNEKDGWTHMLIPNEMEAKEYPLPEPKGIIMVCFLLCDWGNCPDGDVREEDLRAGRLKMKVNDMVVTNFTQSSECSFMKHNDGYLFKHDGKGKFKIEVLVEKSETDHQQYTRITSVIVL